MQPTRSEIIAWAARAIALAEEHLELGDVAEALSMYDNARGWLTAAHRPVDAQWTSGQLVIRRALLQAAVSGAQLAGRHNGVPQPTGGAR